MRRLMLGLVAGLATMLASTLAQAADEFPGGKPITLIIPFAPGGTLDTGFRYLVPGLERELGTQIEVVNKGGAGGQSGITDFVRNAEPDGYTMVVVGLPTVLTQYLDPSRAAIYKRDSFRPLAQAWTSSYGLAVAAESPIKDFTQFLAEAKANPGKVTIADSGLMAAPHLMVALLERTAGVKFASVHLDGGAAASAALLGGHVQAMSSGASDFIANMQAGTVRMIALATEKERANLPGVPTMTSMGVPLVFEVRQGVALPAGTPDAVVARLEDAFRKVLTEDPELQKTMADYGIPADFLGSRDFAAAWDKSEADLRPVFADLLKSLGQ